MESIGAFIEEFAKGCIKITNSEVLFVTTLTPQIGREGVEFT